MCKKILGALGILGALLFSSGGVLAQCSSYTQVTGTVIDPNSIPYAGGTITIDLSPNPTRVPTCTGPDGRQTQFSTHLGPLPLDSTGSFVVQLPPNASITPNTLQWQFTVAIAPGVAPPWGTGPQSYTDPITIAGASQSVSAALTALAPALTVVAPGSGTITPGQISPNQGAVYLSAHCPTNETNCISTFADTQIISDATFTSGSPNVASTSTDPAFTSADVGKKAQATFDCGFSVGNPEKCGNGTTSIGCAETTIKTVTDAHHAVLNANCANSSNPAGSVSNRFAWGHADDTGIANAVAALAARTWGTIYLPCTGMWVEQAAFQLTSPNSGTSGRGPMGVAGCPGGTIIVPGFNFNYATCPTGGGCIYHNSNVADNSQFGWSGNDFFRDVDIQGLGLSCESCSFASLIGAVDVQGFQTVDAVKINGWNWNAPSNFDAAICAGGNITRSYINAGGRNAVRGNTNTCRLQGYNFFNDGNAAALTVTAGTTQSFNNQFFNDGADGCTGANDAIEVSAGAILSSSQDAWTGACISGSAWFVNGLAFGGPATGGGSVTVLTSGAIGHFIGNQFIGGGGFSTVFGSVAGTNVYDDGGNHLVNAPILNGNLFGNSSVTGTTAAAGNLAASAGFGNTAAFTSVSGNAHTVEFTLTNSGTGQAASPTLTYTFPNNPSNSFSYWAAPSCAASQIGGTQGIQDFTRTAISATAVTFQWNGTPTVNLTEIVRVSCQ